jgi:hypothetical protein
MRRTGQVLVALVVIVVLAACGQPGGARPIRPGPLAIEPSWASCQVAVPDQAQLYGADAINLPLLDVTFVPVSAVVCQSRPEKRADGGEDLVATESTTTEITALLAALRMPDEPLSGAICPADLPIVAWFALLDAQGRWVRPGVPQDVCGKIRIEVRDAVAGLALTEVSTRTLREIVSAGANASGCAQQWADMVWVQTTQGGGEWGVFGRDAFGDDGQIRLCLYRVPDSEQRGGKPAGDFERGSVLSAPQWATIREAMRKAGPARDCTTPAGRFALLRRTDDQFGEIYVELDGCRRIVMFPSNDRPSLAQADAALVQLLGSAP